MTASTCNVLELKQTGEDEILDPNSIEQGSFLSSIQCPASKSSLKTSPLKSKLIRLRNIEENDSCNNSDILSKENNNIFFIESSGKNYLKPRDCCAIESAVKNSGLDGHIIIAMTSPYLDVLANNATCHIYTKYSGTSIFFRYINVDTIFMGTPIHQLHLDGNLIHSEKRKTIVQYR